MKLTTRNGIYFVIIIILCLVSFWYFSRNNKYIENLDEMYEIGTNCDGPFGCKTPEEVKKEGAAELKKKQEEISKPPSFPPKILDIELQFTIENQTIPAQGITYNLPKNPYSSSSSKKGLGFGVKTINPLSHLIKSKVLSNTKTDVYMLDVDPKSIGFIEDASYSIATVSVNHPDEILPTNTLNEYIPRNKSLNEIYNRKKDYIDEMYKDRKTKIPICKNSKYTEYTGNNNTKLNVKMDKARPNNNFIILTPNTNDVFPTKFKFEITNNIEKTNHGFNLWGDFMLNQNKSQPSGNPNKILTVEDIINYTDNATRTTFGYNKQAFGESCKKLDESECEIAGMDVGNRCINIIQSGNIYDETGDKIGNASVIQATEKDQNQRIIINVDNENVTGLLIYTSYLM